MAKQVLTEEQIYTEQTFSGMFKLIENKIPFSLQWSNKVGFFPNAIKMVDMKEGDVFKSITPGGRRLIIAMINGIKFSIYDRYMPDFKGKEFTYDAEKDLGLSVQEHEFLTMDDMVKIAMDIVK